MLNTLRWLAVVVWVGGVMFFAFVVAPAAFARLPDAHEAGIVVRGTIIVLHQIGVICGAVLVALTLVFWTRARGPRRLYAAQIALVLAMLVVTVYSQRGVLPAMERDRLQVGGSIEPVDGVGGAGDAVRKDFARLHVLSERLEGFVLLCGLGLVVLMAWEPHPERRGLTVAVSQSGIIIGAQGTHSAGGTEIAARDGEVVNIRQGGG